MEENMVTEQPDAITALTGQTTDEFKMRARSELMASDAVMQEQREKFAEYYANYRMSRQEQEHNYEDAVRLPIIRAGVLSRVPRKMAALFLSTAPCTVEAAPGVPQEQAEAMEDLINQQWSDEDALDGLQFAYKAIKMSELAGTAWAFIGWKTRQTVVQAASEQMDPVTGQMVQIPAQIRIDHDAPYLQLLHPYNTFPDPYHDDERSMEWIWVREELSKTELQSRIESDGYDPALTQEVIDSTESDASYLLGGGSSTRFDSMDVAGVARPQNQILDPRFQPTAVFHRFSRSAWITCDGEANVLRAIPNPSPDGEIPIVGLRPDPDLQGIVGLAPVESASGLQKLMDRTVSQMQTFTNKVVDPLMYIKMTSPLASTKMKNAPGEALMVLEADDVGPVMKDPQTYPITVEHLNMYKYWSDQALNVSDFQKGLGDSGAPDTAFGISKFTAQADSRFSIEFALTVQFFRRIFKKVGIFNQHFLDKPQWVRRIGMQGVKAPVRLINKDLIQGEYRYNMDTAAARTDPQAYASSIVQFAQTWGPVLGPGIYPLARAHGEAIGIKNLDSVVPPPPLPLDPDTENLLLQTGVVPHATMMDNFQDHMAKHQILKTQVMMAGGDPTLIDAHMQEHMMVLQQQMQGGNAVAQGGQPEEGGSDAKKSARDQQREGGQGPTGSPGPAAPPGRSQRAAME